MKPVLENNQLTLYLEGRIDSGNAPAVEKELFAAMEANPQAAVAIDAEKLEYISSAGLRVLMKLRRQVKGALPVFNVSPEVYDVFEVTGFTELLEVHKRLREISVEGLSVIGAGATAKVYRLDRDTVVKVFNANMRPENVQKENACSKNAFIMGVPTAISYDLVKVGECYGSVYELLDAQDFITVMENDRAHLDAHIAKYARTIREMHQIKADPEQFPPYKPSLIAAMPMLSGICSQEELDKLKKIFDSVPDRDTFIHGDCHPGNVMVQNGEFLFIDMMTCGSGHPIIDMMSMCATYHMPMPSSGHEKDSPLVKNFTEEERARIWNVFLRNALGIEDEALMKKAERQITAFAAARILFAAVTLPGFFSPERVEYMKHTALDYVDNNLEPLCF